LQSQQQQQLLLLLLELLLSNPKTWPSVCEVALILIFMHRKLSLVLVVSKSYRDDAVSNDSAIHNC
jgi:hypothetical protein